MSFLRNLFGKDTHDETDVVGLVNKAFHLVEQGNYRTAIQLLEQAIKNDPSCGDAYNELAFIYGKAMGDLDRAEEYARQAIECNPNNPKFYSAINGIQNARAKLLRTRQSIRENTIKRLQAIQRIIDNNPTYPPAYLMKAVTYALSGESKQTWESELKRAEQLYLQNKRSGAGITVTSDAIRNIIERNRQECLEMSRYWNSLPEN